MTLFHGVHPKKITVPALVLTLFFSALAGSLLANSKWAETEVSQLSDMIKTAKTREEERE
jgi:lipopolysaccharide export LptBFGC system permease protein LptF